MAEKGVIEPGNEMRTEKLERQLSKLARGEVIIIINADGLVRSMTMAMKRREFHLLDERSSPTLHRVTRGVRRE